MAETKEETFDANFDDVFVSLVDDDKEPPCIHFGQQEAIDFAKLLAKQARKARAWDPEPSIEVYCFINRLHIVVARIEKPRRNGK